MFEEAKLKGKLDGVGMMVPISYGIIITLKPHDVTAAGLKAAFQKAKITASFQEGDPGEFDAYIIVGLRPLGAR